MHNTIIIQNIYNKKYFGVLAPIIALTFGCLALLNSGISSASTYGCYLLIGWAVFLSVDDLLCLIAITLPLGNIFKFTGGFTAIPFLILLYIIKSLSNKRCRINEYAARPMLWTFVLLFMSLITSTAHYLSALAIFPFYLDVFFIIITRNLNHIDREEMYTKVSFFFVIGTLMVCLGTMIFPAVSRTISNIGIYSKSNAGFSSTWDFGRSLSISIAFIAVVLLKYKKRILLNTLIIIVMLYFLIQCGRFSMLLGLGALLLTIPFVYGANKPVRIRLILTFFMLLFIIIVGYFLFNYVYSSMIEIRGIGATDNGRFDIWRQYIQYLKNNTSIAAFGTGGGTISDVASSLGTVTAHNIVLEKVVEFGIIGIILLLIFFRELYRGTAKQFYRNVNILPLITFIATAMTQGTSGNSTFALLLAMCVSNYQHLYTEEMGK